jgi:hypothetical protein
VTVIAPSPSTYYLDRYLLFFPLFFLYTKSSFSAIQTILHVLFVPTRAKYRFSEMPSEGHQESTEVLARTLRPGALYANCRVVRVALPIPPVSEKDARSGEEGKKGAPEESPADTLGRRVWEMMEKELKVWDGAEQKRLKEENVKQAEEWKPSEATSSEPPTATRS